MAVGTSAAFTPDYAATVTNFKASPKLYRYTGSLTTPPCTEDVKWHVASAPIFTISITDYQSLTSVLEYNARDTKPLFSPYDTEWAKKRRSDYVY